MKENLFLLKDLFRILKDTICKYMNTISKNVYINNLGDMVDKYNNTNQRTIKMKLINVKTSTYIDFDFENNGKDPKGKVGDHVRLSKLNPNLVGLFRGLF